MSESTRPTSALPSPLARSQGIALRRALVLLGMTVLLPGSAQLAVGQRRLGRIAVRIWGGIIALVLILVLLALTPVRSFLLGLYANSIVLTVLAWLVPLLAVGWMILLADALWLANPRQFSTRGKIVAGVTAVALMIGGGSLAWYVSGLFSAQSDLFGNVLGGGGSTQANDGRINVLLLGGDAGADRQGLRPDSITVASIDYQTGRTVLFSLPRNMQHAPFPTDSPLYSKYPNGYYCAVKDLADACLLNGVYTLGVTNKKLFPGVKYPGVEATKSVVEETLGLKINYWAMIDLKGFKNLIDAVGGIRLDINKRVPIGSLHGPKGVYDWIEKGKNVKLDGFHALWFARSREYSTDYERMQRQKCVMNAMLRQLNPATVLTQFQKVASAGKQIVATDVPASELGTLLELASKGKELPMASVSFTPPLIVPMDPDFAKIRSTVTSTIDASEALDDGSKSTASASASSTKKKNTSTKTDNLDKVCSVSK